MSQGNAEKEYENITIVKSPEVTELMDARHISDDEVKLVIWNAETTGEKLYDPDGERLLAKLRIANATFYVEYAKEESEDAYTVFTTYSHMAEVED